MIDECFTDETLSVWMTDNKKKSNSTSALLECRFQLIGRTRLINQLITPVGAITVIFGL